jgi:cellulose synthase/poly-beta-1,6-N-acetylglucosamine synthase-like glycosyltransferase
MILDTDIEVKQGSLNHMVAYILHNTKIMAICDKMEVANDKASSVRVTI